MPERIPSADAKSDAALSVALERAIDALLAGIAHRRGEPGSMPPDEAKAVWNETCAMFRKESYWTFPGEAPGSQPEIHEAQRRPAIFRSNRLLDALMAANLRTVLECSMAGFLALKNHKLGLPADMSLEEAAYTWTEANRLMMDLEKWVFPEDEETNWPGIQGGGGTCGTLH